MNMTAGDLAVDVELELLGRRVADPDRLGALVAGKLRELELGQAPLAADPVHDLDLRRVAGADAQQEVAEGQRLVRVVRGEQRLERQHRVAQPAVPVVPVAHAADVLRQRRRRRRDHRAGRLRGHGLEHDQRASAPPRDTRPRSGSARSTPATTPPCGRAPSRRPRPAASPRRTDARSASAARGRPRPP